MTYHSPSIAQPFLVPPVPKNIPCKIFTKISPRSHDDVCKILTLGEIVARYSPSRRDCRDLAEVVEISP